jgi:quinol monooxygenase YgiN
MWRSAVLTTGLLGLALVTKMTLGRIRPVEGQATARHYLRVSVGHWNIDTYSPDGERIFRQIETDGVAVFRAQPGFVRYRLMRENNRTTIAVAEWESEALGLAGAEHYRAWMRSVGIMDRLTLETHTGQIVA